MEGVNNMGWSNCNIQEVIYEDFNFSFPSQLHPVDFSVETSDYYGFSDYDVPILEMLLNDPFDSSPHIPAQNINYTSFPEIFCCNSGSVSSGLSWDHETKTGFVAKPELENQLVLLDDNKNNTSSWPLVGSEEMQVVVSNEKKKLDKRPRELKKNSSMIMSSTKALSRETISQYFYMPITQAAKELNVGLTLLKKRCRDLGIRRWPHRKLISLQTLIKNVQELGNERSSESNEYLRILEQEKRLLEEVPDMQLEVATKKLRQSFFKANYKKRKLMGLVDSHSSKSEPCTNDTGGSRAMLEGGYEEDDEEIKCFLDDCFSCN